MDEVPAYPRIPYGESDFRRIRLNRWLYVDKTRFLRRLEQERYAFLIRPRRFGKSLWVSLLENYYDRWWGHEFDAVFAGTDIGRDPTAEHHRYVVLRFDFSMVNDKLETLEREFETYCHQELRHALERHQDLFPEAVLQRLLTPPSIATKLSELFLYAGDHDIPLYVLIDEYDKLRHLLVVGRQLNGNFDLLREVIGEGRKDVLRIQPSFPLKRLADRVNFLSLLHYFGLLSIRAVADGMPRLAIPNQTVKQLMYGYLRDGYEDVEVFTVDLYRFEELMMGMANRGEWRPAFEFLGEAIARQTGIRDYIAGEKVIEPRAGALGFLAAYLSVTELGKGHADISLEPLLARFPHLRHGYLIELKYLKRRESADAAGVAAAVSDATEQLRRYLADERLARQFPGVRFVGLAVVFHGWELAHCDAVA